MSRVVRLEDEHRLRHVELTRDRLHLVAVERGCIQHHRKRIAPEPRFREDVERVESELHLRSGVQ